MTLSTQNQDDRTAIAFEMGLAVRQWRSRMDERLAPLGLTQAKWLPLRHLARAGGSLPQRQLVSLLGVEAPSLVRIIDELVELGMVSREDSPTDRRAKIIALSAQAKPLIAKMNTHAAQLRNAVFAQISASELATFRALLKRVLTNLDSLNS